mmetsp:Transcript_2976/g.4104  ORF Transcript_2976/g.4104 Transcript_2976/m.4104 type:complete len:222 (-) Transcript_2976:997-1662(-)
MSSNNSTTSNVISSSTGETFNLNKRSLDEQANSSSSSQLTKLDNLTALEENLQKQLAAHKKILNKIKDGNQKIKKMKDILCVQRRLNDIKRDKLQFTKEEKSLQALCDAEVKFIVNYVVLGQLIFSRKRCASGVNFPVSTRESSSMLSNIIIGGASQDKEYGNTDDYQKDFAMITIRSGEVVVEADQGVLRDITVNGIVEASHTNLLVLRDDFLYYDTIAD